LKPESNRTKQLTSGTELNPGWYWYCSHLALLGVGHLSVYLLTILDTLGTKRSASNFHSACLISSEKKTLKFDLTNITLLVLVKDYESFDFPELIAQLVDLWQLDCDNIERHD
jgi:hypothetical protein